jgi:hypothetical protein
MNFQSTIIYASSKSPEQMPVYTNTRIIMVSFLFDLQPNVLLKIKIEIPTKTEIQSLENEYALRKNDPNNNGKKN